MVAAMVRFLKNGTQRDPMNDRTITDIEKKGLGRLQTRTANFLSDFVGFTVRHSPDLSRTELRETLLALGIPEPADTVPAEAIQRPSGGIAGLQAFVEGRRSGNEDIDHIESEMTGLYMLVRRMDTYSGSHYYEEPFFAGPPSEKSWLLSHQHGPNVGFSVYGSGIFTSFLSHKHKVRTIGFRTIMVYFGEYKGTEYLPGLMVRVSDTRLRPIASNIVVRRIEVSEAQKIRFLECAQSNEAESAIQESRNLTKEVRKEDESYKIYEALNLKGHLKCPIDNEWEAMCHRAQINGTPWTGSP